MEIKATSYHIFIVKCEFQHKNSLYKNFQSGLRVHHSAKTSLRASDEELVSMLVLLGVSADFDAADHQIR